MSSLDRVHTLTWRMEMLERGYTCWTLYDDAGRRWAWVIDAGTTGVWTAHVGDFGQATAVRLPPPPIDNELTAAASAAEGRVWAEQKIAETRKRLNQKRETPR